MDPGGPAVAQIAQDRAGHWAFYIRPVPLGQAKVSLHDDRERHTPAVRLWLGLFLGMTTPAWGQAPDREEPQPFAAADQLVSTAPSSGQPPDPSPISQQLDEFFRKGHEIRRKVEELCKEP